MPTAGVRRLACLWVALGLSFALALAGCSQGADSLAPTTSIAEVGSASHAASPSPSPAVQSTAGVAPARASAEATATRPAPDATEAPMATSTSVPARSIPTSAPTASPTSSSPSPTPAFEGEASDAGRMARATPYGLAGEQTPPAATAARWHQDAAALAAGQLEGVELRSADTALVLARVDSGFASSGTVTSAEHRTPAPFDEAVLSWNAQAPASTQVRLEMRALVGREWTGWYAMGVWQGQQGASVGGQADGWGRVDVDTLKLAEPAQALQMRAVLSTDDPSRTPTLTDLWVAYADSTRPPVGPPVSLEADWARDLPVPGESQAVQDPSYAWQICSPTSLTMVLEYWGVQTTVPEVARGVRDGGTGIWGNWPLNTAYAATFGLSAHVDRFYSIDQVQAEIAQGRPVIASIKVLPGELPNSPVRSAPQGHLIVVRGFTPEGDVIVNDPAGPSPSQVGWVYKRADFERVWLQRGGVVYLIAPRD